MTTTFDPNLTPQQQIDAGHVHKWFSISSEGEVNHRWSDGRDTFAKSDSVRDLYVEMIDNREVLLYRMWEHLTPLGTSLWRFYVNWSNGGEPRLTMETEYVFDEGYGYDVQEAHAEHWPALEAMAKHHGAVIEDMSGAHEYHYCVQFNVFGMSLPECAALQYKWFTEEEPHHQFVLQVL
jgi:hypothetical protein